MNAFEYPVGLCLLGLVAIAAGTDLRARRIPNRLVLSALALALAVQWHLHGAHDGGSRWALGILTGGGLFLPLYLLRGMGAGDVKLMAAVGAFVQPGIALQIALLTCAIGGVWALVAIVMRRKVKSTSANILAMVLARVAPSGIGASASESVTSVSAGALPYGVVIAFGTLGAMMMNAGHGVF